LIFVTGTDTGVGKTLVAGALARNLSDRGLDVGVMKPVETGHDEPEGWPEDAAFLAEAARVADPREDVVPFDYAEPLAPLIAARRANAPIDVGAILEAFARLKARHPLMIVEGAGGMSVEITEDVDTAGLAVAMDLPVLVVARPDLGTLNHTFLTIEYARSRGLSISGIVICHTRPPEGSLAEETNPVALEERCGAEILATVPYLDVRDRLAGAAEAVDELAARLARPKV